MSTGGVLSQREADRFVGRSADLARLDALLGDEPTTPIVFVHGPGGIGKSSLLRELGRRAASRGIPVSRLDGRERTAVHDRVAITLDAIPRTAPALLLVDTYEQAPALGALLRRDLERCLAGGTRVLLAGRQPPEPAWLEDGWGEVVGVRRLATLTPAESRALVERRGLREPRSIERLVAWGEGSPLALTVAADALLAGHDLDLDRLDADGLLASTLVQRLAGSELDGADHDVLAVASIARAVDARTLAAVLPGSDGDHAEAWLRGLSFGEPLGTRLTLHDRVRKAVRGALVADDPEHDRELRRRLADHLYRRAVLGDTRLMVDISELVDDPQIRWGIAPGPTRIVAGPPTADDAATISTALGADGTRWWQTLQRWFDEAPEHVLVMREVGGPPLAYGIWLTSERAPAWVDDDPIVGPWLADSRVRYPGEQVLLLREGTHLPGLDPASASAAVSVGNQRIVVASGLPVIRALYASPAPPDQEQTEQFLLALGYEHLEACDVADGERTVRCFVNDFGPGGLLRAARDWVYHDLGLIPPPPAMPEVVAAEIVRDALRSFHDPVAIAASPLARGTTTTARAEAVREQLRRATAAAFGDSPDERLLRATIERGYFDPDGGHARAALELRVSRATYFRRLADAAARVSAYVRADRG